MEFTSKLESSVKIQTPACSRITALWLLMFCAVLVSPCFASECLPPENLGPLATRLVVITPATSQDREHWLRFIATLKSDPRSKDIAILLFEHGIHFTSLGSAYSIASELDACIASKNVDGRYTSVTLIGHSIGGMLARRAYLNASGATEDTAVRQGTWANKVDRILLFASVNKGIPSDATWWAPIASWLLRLVPHPKLALEDFAKGSDFIADTRIAWLRHFGKWSTDNPDLPTHAQPYVVQFWGTVDSIVKEKDNADIEAFSGPVVVRIPGAEHGNLQRLEPSFTQDSGARWALFRRELFDSIPKAASRTYPPRRMLFIVRGIRDSSNSNWAQDLEGRAKELYHGNVESPEYGYFTAAQFALRPIRAKNIPSFRDLYSERLAENPRTQFDLIAHSNGTYIFGQSALSTPSMKFTNVVLAAPVLPEDFDWGTLIRRKQIQNVRYDAASLDWPVGILCPALRALGFSDVGPAGLVLFGTPDRIVGSRAIKKVGWYSGGHGAALSLESTEGVDNRQHLLNFAHGGTDLGSGENLLSDPGWLPTLSRATPYVIWLTIVVILLSIIRRLRAGQAPTRRGIALVAGVFFLLYIALDTF